MSKRFLLSSLAVFLVFSSAAYADPAVMTHMQGEVVVVHEDGKTEPASVGMQVSAGDSIKTGTASQADVSINGEAGVRVLESTSIGIESTEADMKVSLEIGNVIANLKKKLSENASFELQTPAAVLAVRGTQFWGRADVPEGMPRATFAVRRGSVKVLAKKTGESFTIEEGKAIEIPLADTKTQVRSALPEELAALEQADGITIR